MKTLEKTAELGEASAEVANNTVKITGPKGTLERTFREKLIEITKKDKMLVISALSPGKKGKRVMNSIQAHLRNMVKGVTEGYEYQLKICSGHFPMNVAVSGKEITIKNFIGEKHPRNCRIKQDVEIKMDKETITVSGRDKEQVGQAAAEIEKATKIRNKDRRIFMDGIYITSKGQNG